MQCGVSAEIAAPNSELPMNLRGRLALLRATRNAGSIGPFDSNPTSPPKASAQMPDKDRLPTKLESEPGERDQISATPLEFGPNGEIEFEEAVPRRRNDVLRILREEAAHAAVEDQKASVPRAPNQAGPDDSKAVRSANSQLIVRTGKQRTSDGNGIRTPTTASNGWLRALVFALVATFAIAAFAFQFALDIGNWAPWLQPYLGEYVHAVNRLAESFGELL